MPRTPPRKILDDEVVSQYGVDGNWRNEPRWTKEDSVSMLLGTWGAVEAGDRIRINGALADGTECVRMTTANELRAQGFRVTHTPSRKNPDHVSVAPLGDWNAEAFEACFDQHQVVIDRADELEEEAT